MWLFFAFGGLALIAVAVLARRKEPAGAGRAAAAPAGSAAAPPARPSAAEALARVRALQARGGQWEDIFAVLDPQADPAVRGPLLGIRNDGLQFAPADALRRLELAAQAVAADPAADLLAVVAAAADRADVLDRYR
jgi:hypothetical protein